MAIKSTITVKGLIILRREKPLDFSAVNSLFSEKFPKVMREESKIERGSASGIKLAETNNSNSKITQILSPFPIKSSIYTQKNCMMSINIAMTSVMKNGPIKERILKRYSRFNYFFYKSRITSLILRSNQSLEFGYLLIPKHDTILLLLRFTKISNGKGDFRS